MTLASEADSGLLNDLKALVTTHLKGLRNALYFSPTFRAIKISWEKQALQKMSSQIKKLQTGMRK